MYLGGGTALPLEYAFLALADLKRELPEDAAGRVLLALDCANEKRMAAAAEILERVPLSIDVDHHHDNSRFGAINHVVADATSTTSAWGRSTPRASSTTSARSREPSWPRRFASRPSRPTPRAGSACVPPATRWTCRRSPGSGEAVGTGRLPGSRAPSRSKRS